MISVGRISRFVGENISIKLKYLPLTLPLLRDATQEEWHVGPNQGRRGRGDSNQIHAGGPGGCGAHEGKQPRQDTLF